MRERGFTLIELVIVVGIIATLAVLAIPSYQDYMIRARVTEGLSLASPAQMAIAESASSHNVLPATQAETGFRSTAGTANVESLTIAYDGTSEITITYTERAGGGTIILKPTLQQNNDITWTCTGGTLINQYRPVNCR